MNKVITAALVLLAMLAAFATTAAAQAGDLIGAEVSVQNTFEQPGADERNFGPRQTATVGDEVEFTPIGYYDTDIDADSISMSWSSDARWDGYERVLEEDYFDRYYFEFDVNIASATADETAPLVPSVSIENGNTVIVEFGEGLEVGDGFDVVIDVVPGDSTGDAMADDDSDADDVGSADDDAQTTSDDDTTDDDTADDDDADAADDDDADTDDDTADDVDDDDDADAADDDDSAIGSDESDATGSSDAASTTSESTSTLPSTGAASATMATIGLLMVCLGAAVWHIYESARHRA